MNETQIRELLNDRDAIQEYIESFPPDHLFDPDDPCQCILHGYLLDETGADEIVVHVDHITIYKAGEIENPLGFAIDVRLDTASDFASIIQDAWMDFAPILTPDEAIRVLTEVRA